MVNTWAEGRESSQQPWTPHAGTHIQCLLLPRAWTTPTGMWWEQGQARDLTVAATKRVPLSCPACARALRDASSWATRGVFQLLYGFINRQHPHFLFLVRKASGHH